MKNRSILLALALSISFFATSCSSDDNEGETLAPLTGKWNLSQVGTVVSGNEVLTDAPQNQSGCNKDYLELKLDNTATEGDYDSTISPCALDIDSGIYSRSHNNLTTVIDGVEKTQDIVNLTLKELKLKDANGAITVYTRD
ncbi:lipocalin family protein [Flavobacterium piscis]|uniref:Lipocalin-like domain-containing protein n=1 Tax=Flavobacterium piscis TaxID=1114874 RepID=A0ABU1Y645_9FLAO|nr:lipocalin family protein [Flavobacterium piscis]MDR7209140.1 hypothetical protein [Flavobacterium piscis]